MSNPRKWRVKTRTAKPNARQKRNGLFLDAHPICQGCRSAPSVEAHHAPPPGTPGRDDWESMTALCQPCHVHVHQHFTIVMPPPVI